MLQIFEIKKNNHTLTVIIEGQNSFWKETHWQRQLRAEQRKKIWNSKEKYKYKQTFLHWVSTPRCRPSRKKRTPADKLQSMRKSSQSLQKNKFKVFFCQFEICYHKETKKWNLLLNAVRKSILILDNNFTGKNFSDINLRNNSKKKKKKLVSDDTINHPKHE